MKNLILNSVCIVAVCALCANGCVPLMVGAAGAGAGVGTYAYVKGQLEVTYSATYEQTWQATLDALDGLGISVETSGKDAFGGKIKAKRADGTSVRLKVAPITSNSTSVNIRVGVFGNQTVSEGISAEIASRLKN